MGRRRRAASASSAARDSTSWSRCRMLYTLAPSAGSTSTQGRLDAASRSASLPRQSRRPELQLGMHVRQPPLPASDPGQVGRGQPQRLSAAPQACALSLNSRKLCASPSAGKRPRAGCPLPRADPGHARLPSRPTRQSRQQVPVPLGHTDTPCPCVSRPPGAQGRRAAPAVRAHLAAVDEEHRAPRRVGHQRVQMLVQQPLRARRTMKLDAARSGRRARQGRQVRRPCACILECGGCRCSTHPMMTPCQSSSVVQQGFVPASPLTASSDRRTPHGTHITGLQPPSRPRGVWPGTQRQRVQQVQEQAEVPSGIPGRTVLPASSARVSSRCRRPSDALACSRTHTR